MKKRFKRHLLRQIGGSDGTKKQDKRRGNQEGSFWFLFHKPDSGAERVVEIRSHQNSPQNEGVFPVQIVADNGKIRCKPPVSFDKKDGISRNNNISYQVKQNAKIPLQINLQKSSIPECKRYRVKFL